MSDEYSQSKLLIIPSSSNGLSAYNPSFGSVILNAGDLKQRRATDSDSPPRKTARLAGDIDHFASRNRTKEKGKGKERLAASTSIKATEKKLTLVGLPANLYEEEYLVKLGPLVGRAIRSVLTRPGTIAEKQRPFPSTYEDVYQAMRTIVLLTDGGQVTYSLLQREFEETAGSVSEFLSNLQTRNEVDWLEELINTHTCYERSVRLLESLLAFLDGAFLDQKPELKHIRELATETFTLRVFGRQSIVSKIKNSINEWITSERNERKPHPKRHIIANFVNALQNHGLFSSLFLESYVSFTEAYYTSESENLAIELGKRPGEFIKRTEERLAEEEERARSVLSSFRWCWKDLKHTAEKSLLDNRLAWLRLNIGPEIDEERIDGLKRMYLLFASVGGLKTLCDAFKAHVHKRVEDIVNDTAHDEDMVDRLLRFKRFTDSAVSSAFMDEIVTEQIPSDSSEDVEMKSGDQPTATVKTSEINRDFLYAARDAFQTGFRVRRNKPAEMIAKFIDRAMRRGQRDASDEEFSALLDNVLGLYRFTQDKDVFRTFYHRALAKRLLLQRSASDDFEKAVLKKLKDHYDPEFSMGDHMFRDLALSRDIMEEFHNKAIGQGSAEKLNVMVLQRSFWPFSARTTDDILLPYDMQGDLTKFTTFYKNAHQGHKLDFDHSLGTVQLWARFDRGKKELSVSLYQTAVLLLFNNSDELSYEDIKQSTRMVEDDLKRTLQSLACAREKVLRKKPVGKDVNSTDVFVFDPSYWHDKVRVHINQIQAKETPEETRKTHDAIEGDRRHYLDAAIVRIMKAKKTMSHNLLVNDTIDAVKNHFKPEAKDIKQRIEQLIEQEYIRRDDDLANTYVYVA